MYKLIALDIDGTLLNSEKKITNEVFNSIQEAKKSGAKVVLSRPLPGVTPLLDELNLNDDGDYVICFNGAVVQEVKSKKILSNIEMCHDDFVLINNLAKENNTHVHINTPTNLIIPEETPNKYTIHEATLNNIDIVSMNEEDINDDITFCKIMIIDEPEKLEEVLENIPKDLFDKYTIVRSAPFFLEFLNKNANKGTALEALCNTINIPLSKSIAVGDEENDQHMIKMAGLGVAMGNATEHLKSIADYVTKSNDEDGVAYAIENILLN